MRSASLSSPGWPRRSPPRPPPSAASPPRSSCPPSSTAGRWSRGAAPTRATRCSSRARRRTSSRSEATEFRAGRPFTDIENRSAAKVAVLGSNIARALFGAAPSVGKSFTLAGDTYFVVGEAAPRRGGFFGENRQDNVISIPAGTVARRFPEAKQAILYARAMPGALAAGEVGDGVPAAPVAGAGARRGERLQPVDRRADHRAVRSDWRADRRWRRSRWPR